METELQILLMDLPKDLLVLTGEFLSSSVSRQHGWYVLFKTLDSATICNVFCNYEKLLQKSNCEICPPEYEGFYFVIAFSQVGPLSISKKILGMLAFRDVPMSYESAAVLVVTTEDIFTAHMLPDNLKASTWYLSKVIYSLHRFLPEEYKKSKNVCARLIHHTATEFFRRWPTRQVIEAYLTAPRLRQGRA